MWQTCHGAVFQRAVIAEKELERMRQSGSAVGVSGDDFHGSLLQDRVKCHLTV